MTENQINNKRSCLKGQGILLRYLESIMSHSESQGMDGDIQLLDTQQPERQSSDPAPPTRLSVSVTPILPEDLFGIVPSQFYLIKSYSHQTKDVILRSNTFRFYMQIISLNIG
jgi:hypothetical protein